MKPNILLLLVSFAAAVVSLSLKAEAQGTAAPGGTGTPQATTSTIGTAPAKTGLTKTELRKLIENTEWVIGKEGSQIFFLRGGQMIGLGRKFYTVEAPDILRIYEKDPAKDRKADFIQFRINVAAMFADFDPEGTTQLGGKGKPMKYVGPATKK